MEPEQDATWAVLLTVAANLISHLTDVVPALEPYSLPSLLLLLTPLIPMRNIQRQANLASGDPQEHGQRRLFGLQPAVHRARRALLAADPDRFRGDPLRLVPGLSRLS